ncbi:hypothetical protein BS78_03G092700 [Paspalum vaginatum]|nr:hypothetical protein BS78_03G092700 [Paspalum vaginatum]
MKKLSSSSLPLPPATMCMLIVTIMLAITISRSVVVDCSEVVHAAQGEAAVHLDGTRHGMGPPSPHGEPIRTPSPTPPCPYPKCRRPHPAGAPPPPCYASPTAPPPPAHRKITGGA